MGFYDLSEVGARHSYLTQIHWEIAPYAPTSEFRFMVLVSKAPALVWEAQMTGTGKLGQLKAKDPWPY